MYSLGSVSSLVSEKKIFEISANQSILLALAAIFITVYDKLFLYFPIFVWDF
jgi:hypothetical protein